MESHVLTEILRYLNYEDPPIIIHRIVPSTHINDLWYLGCILYHSLFGSPLYNFDLDGGGLVSVIAVSVASAAACLSFESVSAVPLLSSPSSEQKS